MPKIIANRFYAINYQLNDYAVQTILRRSGRPFRDAKQIVDNSFVAGFPIVAYGAEALAFLSAISARILIEGKKAEKIQKRIRVCCETQSEQKLKMLIGDKHQLGF